MKRSLLLLGMAISAALSTQAQPGIVNLDINPGLGNASPVYLHAVGKNIYCFANNGTSGRELFWADSVTKPKLVQDMNTGLDNAIPVAMGSPMIGHGGNLYFTADNGASGLELYRYDGTNNPSLVWDIMTGGADASPDNYVEHLGTIYFRARTDANGYELWEYNTTTQQTKRLTDIQAGADSSLTGEIVYFNNHLVFTAENSSKGEELWQYNVLTQQASLIMDIDTGTASSSPRNLTVIDNKLYFSATELHTGRELYEYDGTGVPKRVTDLNPGFTSGLTEAPGVGIIKYGSKIYFPGRGTDNEVHLYSYDPVGQTTKLISKTNPGGNTYPQHFAVYKGRLFFSADDGANGRELYAYDGTNHPVLMGDICKGPNGSMPAELTVIGNNLYFSANDCQTSGSELFKYNQETVGLRTSLFDGKVTLYPNPVQRDLRIELELKRDEDLRIIVADMNGQRIYDTELVPYPQGKSKLEVPMKRLPAGPYLYYIQNKDKTTYLTGRVIKL